MLDRIKRIYTWERLKRGLFALIAVAPVVCVLEGYWSWLYMLEVFFIGMIWLPFMDYVFIEKRGKQ